MSKKKRKRIKVRNRETFKTYGMRCYLCGTQLSLKGLRNSPNLATRDHILPHSRGGYRTSLNIRPCCQPCNSLKSNSIPPLHVLLYILWKGNLYT